ncbi:polymer-forming cytoskeletal protein [Acidobacteria bacterium ACD]|nr:MAG: polymer-forming cytoskeletal protein [Acidobacteriota bacterium]MCE7958361.1 polymer-forming cytoskeletal protein [Acidobacteria bacterium ACB2]MDL1949487.1 polymer-forming cytoskeletal protein [Acidobacteria bacterium ACD]
MKPKGPGVLNGFLDRGARFEGTLTFDDTFRIDGTLKGSVVSRNELVVGEAGVVEGEVRVGRLSVSGTLRGVVHARERIEVHAGARVQAELHTPALTVEDGAVIQGPVETGPQLARDPETRQGG